MLGEPKVWSEKFMLWCADLAYYRPKTVMAVALAALLCCLSYSASQLRVVTDRSALVSSHDRLFALQQKYLKEFPASDDVVVLVEGGSRADRERYIDSLATSLEKRPDLFQSVFPKVRLGFLYYQALTFLDDSQLQDIAEKLKSVSESGGSQGSVPDHFSREEFQEILPTLTALLGELRQTLETRAKRPVHLPFPALGTTDGETSNPLSMLHQAENGVYHTLDGGRVHLLLLRLSRTDQPTLDTLRSMVSAQSKPFPQLAVSITGENVLDMDESRCSQEDSTWSGAWSMVMVTALFLLVFRQLGKPMAILVSFLLGTGWTLGAATAVVGHLNLLTVSFFTILVGSGVDFGIHIVLRFEEEQAAGHTDHQALRKALVGSGVDISVSALATAVAFGAVGLSSFRGVAELGIIAGIGIVLCLLATLLPLPALLVLWGGSARPMESHQLLLSYLRRGEELLLRHSRMFLAMVFLGLLLLGVKASGVGFDYNLLHMQNPSLESVQTELELMRRGGDAVLFGVSLAPDMETARALKERFEALPGVSKVDCICDLFPPIDSRKRELISEVQREAVSLEGYSSSKRSTGADHLREMGAGFEKLDSLVREQQRRARQADDRKMLAAIAEFEHQEQQLASTLSRMGPGPIEDGVSHFESGIRGDLKTILKLLASQHVPVDGGFSALPNDLRERSVGAQGAVALRVYPRKSLWDKKELDTFVEELRSVDPEVVGSPVMIAHHTESMRRAFEEAGMAAGVAVFAILWLYFRSFRWASLAALPLVTGSVFMAGMMKLFGVSFNLANFIGLPLLLGIGMDYGVHVLHRMKEQRAVGVFDGSTGPATLMSAVTTIAGFGTLALAGHRGMASLGFVLSFGVIGILFSALFVLPAIVSVSPTLQSDILTES